MSTLVDDLRTLHEAGKLRSANFPVIHVIEVGPTPVLVEAARVGVLGALAREALGCPHAWCEPVDRMDPGSRWEVYANRGAGWVDCPGSGATEADAWVSVLHAAAEDVRHPSPPQPAPDPVSRRVAVGKVTHSIRPPIILTEDEP